MCIDAINHQPDRPRVCRDWARLFAPRGRLLFTDPITVTGPLGSDETAIRASIAYFLFVPPGEDERLLSEAALRVLAVEDATETMATVAERSCQRRRRPASGSRPPARRARPRPRRCDPTSHADRLNVDWPPSAASRRARGVHRDRASSAPACPKRGGSPARPRPARHPPAAPSPPRSRTRADPPRRSSSPRTRPVATLTAASVCDQLVAVRPEQDHDPRPHPFHPNAGRPADRGCWGRCHAPGARQRRAPARRHARSRRPRWRRWPLPRGLA